MLPRNRLPLLRVASWLKGLLLIGQNILYGPMALRARFNIEIDTHSVSPSQDAANKIQRHAQFGCDVSGTLTSKVQTIDAINLLQCES